MAKKTRKSSREIFEEETFFDRDKAREKFWERYECVKNNGDFQVLMFYGLGGMGKTSLLHQIAKEIDANQEGTIWEYYDHNDGQDSVVVLRRIVKDLQKKYKFKFPMFLYSVYSYMLKCGEDADASEVKSVLDDIPVLREAFRLANIIPGVSTFTQPAEWLADKIYDSVDYVKKRKFKEMIEKINNASKEKLHDELPFVFVHELNENLKNKGNPLFVLMLDTYERLVNELATIGTPVENDLWLRDDNEGILFQINNLVCVLAGRERLKWRDMDPDWDECVLTQVEIDTLDRDNSLSLLKRYDVIGDEIKEKIIEVTQGMPLYLDVCIDTYKSAKACSGNVTKDLFDNKIDKLAKRLLTYMSDDEKDVLYLLSCLGKWKEEEYTVINDQLKRNSVNNSIYNKILTLTFVRNESKQYYIHQTMQEILIQYCEEDKIKNYVIAMYEYAKTENIYSTIYFKYVYLISKICTIRKNIEITEWWVDKIYTSFEAYLDSFYLIQFFSIYEMLETLTDDYRLKTLYLNYLLKKSDYEEAFKYIEQFHAEDGNNVEVLKFYLTASYYYYIKGIDDEALRLRKRVFEKRKEILGINDRETIKAGLSLAASYSRIGRHEESIALGNECRKMLHETTEAYDSMISAAQNQLGDSYFRLGKMHEAESIYREVYENRKKWLGEKNNSTMIAYNHIADCLVNHGKYNEALKIYRSVRETRAQEFCRDKMYDYFLDGQKKQSNDHPDTIIVDNNMAVCMINMGKYREALVILKEVVAKREVTLGENAPATMGALENLTMCEFYCGLVNDARINISKVIKGFSEKMPEDHYDVIIAKYHKAIIESNNKEIASILDHHQEALKFNKSYISDMNNRKFIGYFSLGRYYE